MCRNFSIALAQALAGARGLDARRRAEAMLVARRGVAPWRAVAARILWHHYSRRRDCAAPRRRRDQAPAAPPVPAPRARATTYIRPTTWPSGSANSAIVVSGATSVSGMITRPPDASALARTPFGSSECT